MLSTLIFWLILALVFLAAYTLGVRRTMARYSPAAGPAGEAPPILASEWLMNLQAKLAPMLAITGHRAFGEVVEFTGHLKGKADEMFRRIREAFAGEPVTPLLLEGERDDVRLLVLPKAQVAPVASRPKWAVHWLLFLATVATTTWAGALHAGVNLLQEPGRFAVGLPYSLGLLLILGAHELGHYFTAKAHGIQVTPPFFIPVPFALGTFGAFIRIKSLPPNRRALFDVAVAGPLAGLVFAIPALLVGLHFSQVIPGNAPADLAQGSVNIGSSLLLAGLARLSMGPEILQGSHLLLHPLAFAGWLGLIVTALNLLPIGQLDGGHMSHALFGSRHAQGISVVALASLFLLAVFFWPGLLFWALIVFFIAGTRDAPAANDLSPIDPQRKLVGYLTFLLLLLIIIPVPHSLYHHIPVHSPYF
jgi:membrane-associated protease RseP (regulator of RpoE activity)